MSFNKLIWVIYFLGFVVDERIGGGIGHDNVVNPDLKRFKFPALYNFGDSNSDTGGRSAAIADVPLTNAETFFGVPSGRFCDGRLIIDFIAEKLGLPYLSAYLDSIGTNFRHGANFAIAGSSIRHGGYSPFPLDIQIAQFLRFKSQTAALYKNCSNKMTIQSNLPRPEDFSNALYMFDIGQNDLAFGFQNSTIAETQASIPKMINKFAAAVNKLYNAAGARNFWVHNTGPIGCIPFNKKYYRSKPDKLDMNGCVEVLNRVAREFNKQLKEKVLQLGKDLPGAAFTFVDVYSVKYSLVSDAKKLGFEDPFECCSSGNFGNTVDCGNKTIVNGTVYVNPCPNPSRLISWDSLHYTEAANMFVANIILNASLGPQSLNSKGLPQFHDPKQLI
ncbi:hypothetical protein ACH5RR_011077 [Cinchona calisaya]|uniref:Uncharacterized protein n=1 Tax=Cinchona calisaya TaxID=153742 RepID=A0ABD3A696_9GENT